MEILGKGKLEQFRRKHPDSRKALTRWIADVEREDWQTPQDIKAVYQSADFLAGNRVIFNIRGNNHKQITPIIHQPNPHIIKCVGTQADHTMQSF